MDTRAIWHIVSPLNRLRCCALAFKSSGYKYLRYHSDAFRKRGDRILSCSWVHAAIDNFDISCLLRNAHEEYNVLLWRLTISRKIPFLEHTGCVIDSLLHHMELPQVLIALS
jgi:hypothetical protein